MDVEEFCLSSILNLFWQFVFVSFVLRFCLVLIAFAHASTLEGMLFQLVTFLSFWIKLFWRTRDLGYLLESIMILEFGLTIRRLEIYSY